MLPVVGNPEIAVSSNSAFARLQAATNPQYNLNVTVEGDCIGDAIFASDSQNEGSARGGADAGATPPGVNVVDEGSVGPYDFVIISVDEGAADPASMAVEWLRDNNYDVNEFGRDRLTPYLENGMNLLAFRLTKGSDAGSIRPVVLNFGRGLPSIPIRPTAVAATDDMGVMVWVLGEHRAIPANYFSLELNEALIDWINPNNNYNDVVTRAANEAGGQGFVTEMAGPSESLGEVIFASWEEDAWNNTYREQDWSDRHGQLLSAVLFSSIGTFDGMRDVIRDTLSPPEGVSMDEFLNCPGCYLDFNETHIDGFDPQAFLNAVQDDVIRPMQETQALFDAIPYVTRFYTTMSADEMTVDPIFDFNADLPDYSNIHTAEQVIECAGRYSRFDAPWRISLPDGTVVRGRAQTWPIDMSSEIPANQRIVRLGNTGQGSVIEDNRETIQHNVIRNNRVHARTYVDHGGCSMSPGKSASASVFALIGLAFFLRRRRSQRRV